MTLIVTAFDRWEYLADKHLRGICQDLDCERVAEVSDKVTSLAYCADHYIAMRMEENRAWFRHLEYQHINRYAE